MLGATNIRMLVLSCLMQNIEIPWDWYIVRASALIGFLLLYISVFVGTVSCLPGIRKYFLRLRSLNFHCWISLQALIFALIHGDRSAFSPIHSIRSRGYSHSFSLEL